MVKKSVNLIGQEHILISNLKLCIKFRKIVYFVINQSILHSNLFLIRSNPPSNPRDTEYVQTSLGPANHVSSGLTINMSLKSFLYQVAFRAMSVHLCIHLFNNFGQNTTQVYVFIPYKVVIHHKGSVLRTKTFWPASQPTKKVPKIVFIEYGCVIYCYQVHRRQISKIQRKMTCPQHTALPKYWCLALK